VRIEKNKRIAAAGSTDAGSPQNTEDDFNNPPAKKASAKDRHGFYQADNASHP